jgi:hypothetical protein
MRKKLLKIFMVAVLAASFSGCAVMSCDVKGLREIKEANAKVFDKDISRCYNMALEALQKWNAVAFKQSKNDYIVALKLDKAFRSCIDTTELGIFFTETAPGKTAIKITSLNYNLSQYIAQKMFRYIETDGKEPAQETKS